MMGGLSVDRNLLELVTVDPVWEVHHCLVTYLNFQFLLILLVFSVSHYNTILVTLLTTTTIFTFFLIVPVPIPGQPSRPGVG